MGATSYTRSEARTQILRPLGDPTAKFYSTDMVNDAIDKRLADFCLRSQCRRYTWRKDLVANQTIIDLTTLTPRVIDIQDVALPSSADGEQEMPLPFKSMEWLNANYPAWRTQESAWPQRYSRFTEGFDGLVLHPAPSSSQSAQVTAGPVVASSPYGIIISVLGITAAAATSAYGSTINVDFLSGNLRIDGIAHSTDLTSDSDTLEDGGCPIQYQEAIISGAIADLSRLATVIAIPALIEQHESRYEALLAKASRQAKSGFQSKPALTQQGSNF